ncbi:hypothetical protein [Geminisphaera colitermitum]|uniref:hypothetical protein n=1 Tax=Geminisphaera colitermitum TaxID=1148786 RepID=UPI000158C5F9|nr:hypothetical protein [Geminisphaera colitermitum]
MRANWSASGRTRTCALPSPAEVVELDDVRDSLDAAFERLTPNQALALRRYYPEDATPDEIRPSNSVSHASVRVRSGKPVRIDSTLNSVSSLSDRHDLFRER